MLTQWLIFLGFLLAVGMLIATTSPEEHISIRGGWLALGAGLLGFWSIVIYLLADLIAKWL